MAPLTGSMGYGSTGGWTLSNLRRMIGDRVQGAEPFLLVTHRTIRFNPASDA
jgi:hypothetical protein